MNDAAKPIRLEIAENVATITLMRPDRMNALTPELLGLIPYTLAQAVDGGARAIILTGEGKGFCSGAELGGFGPSGTVDLGDVIRDHYAPMARALADLPVPLITAVNGAAAGAGAAIALSGDIIIAARSAFFLFAFAKVGLVPDAGASWLVTRAVGRVRAMERALLADRLNAETAKEWRLVTRAADDALLMAEAQATARKLAEMPPLALGLIRAQMRAAIDAPFVDMLEMEAENQRRAGFSADHAEGARAFKEKRPPQFTGR